MKNSIKKELILEGLDCANCAAKIEEKVKEINGVSNACLNFMVKSLTIEADDAGQMDKIVSETRGIIKRLEPHVDVTEKETDSLSKTIDCKDRQEENRKEIFRLIMGAMLFGIAAVFRLPYLMEVSLYFISYLLLGSEVLLKALKNIARGQAFDENFLMAVATIGAFAIHEFPEGAAVMLFYKIGEYFENMAVNRSRKSIAELMNIRPDYANIKTQNKIQRVVPEAVRIGDIIIVKPGEKIPLDGKVIEGKSTVDTSAITGESFPREVGPQDEVLSGFINHNGMLEIEVTKQFGESTAAKILKLVEDAGSRKAPTENFITKFARYYTPAVVFTALGIAVFPPLAIQDAVFSEWLYRALIFLVVSCPCALVISVPLSFFGGIGGASRKGILIKGGNYLEALTDVHTVVFDKTGTLTKGIFKVAKVNHRNDLTREDLLKYAAFAEAYSNHPIAVSILNAYGKEVDKGAILSYAEIPGQGIKVNVAGEEILAGNSKLMDKEGINYNVDCNEEKTAGTIVHIAVDRKYAGYLVIADEVKEDAAQTIKNLKNLGIEKIAMLTGDNLVAANKAGSEVGIDEIYAELLPHEKLYKLEMLNKRKISKGALVFVGDGVNDAPVLAMADVGVAMGAVGSDAAIEAADVVLMTDELSKLVDAIKIAKRTKKIVWQNIIFALGVKGIVLFLGASGVAAIWEAVFADVGVALIAVLNAMRVIRVK